MGKHPILVTGGFGFLGTHLVEELLENSENYVHVVDDLSTSPVDYKAFVAQLKQPERFSWDICSIEEFSVSKKYRNYNFNQIYHLASIVGPVGVLKHSGKIAKCIIGDTYRLINIAQKMNARLLDVSTSEIYGGGRDGYCSEKDSKIITSKVSVRLEYAVAKLTSEVALMNTIRVTDLQAVLVRPFNIAGPRQSGEGGFVLPRFINQAINGEPLTVYYDGSAIRAFSHVKDMVAGIKLAMERGKNGEAYNIGTPRNKTTILELAERVLDIVPSNSEISFVDPKEMFGPLFEEANDKYPDADRAIKELGWSPKYDIETVIQDSYDYIKEKRCD